MMTTRLVRSAKGKTIHRSDCPQVQMPRRSHPWIWAETKTRGAIELSVLKMNLHLCKTCKPLDEWNGPFHACTFMEGCACVARCEAFERHVAHQCCM